MQIVGAMMGSAVVIYMTVAVLSLLQQSRRKQQHSLLAYELLRQKIKSSIVERFYLDQAHLCWNGTRKFVVVSKTEEANGIYSFDLKPHDGRVLPLFQPGQFLTFQLNVPGQEKPIVRCYSLSDAPSIEQYQVTIKRVESGLGSGYFHDDVQEGTILDVQSPRGSFCINPTTAKPMVFIAGGVGVTPFLSMLKAIDQSQTKSEIYLFYAVQSDQDIVQYDYLKNLADRHENIHIYTGFSNSSVTDTNNQSQFSGHLTIDYLQSVLPSSNFDFYMCGPPSMMKSLINGLNSWKVPTKNIFSEAFGTPSVKAAIKNIDAETKKSRVKTESLPTITFKKSKTEKIWNPTDDDLLSFAESANISVEAGCRAGSCGSCETAIRSGSVKYLTPPGYECPKGSCLPCVAIPESDLELDL